MNLKSAVLSGQGSRRSSSLSSLGLLSRGRPRAQRKRSINARVAVTIADVGPQSHSPQERLALQPTRSEWLGEKREGDTQEGKNENGDMGSTPRH